MTKWQFSNLQSYFGAYRNIRDPVNLDSEARSCAIRAQKSARCTESRNAYRVEMPFV